ncbi:temperature-induced lipocalin-1-like [Solanum stenotomum]|uniref:temperature-induced lipocalin-1-like n=1 Tax=Solanum stenotomum TaxID=172797 RepID=UPI0020D0370F|nr:temperature-induced lipocalin-1-like [Solanum stenotomum]
MEMEKQKEKEKQEQNEEHHIDKKQKTENQQDEVVKARRPLKLSRKNTLHPKESIHDLLRFGCSEKKPTCCFVIEGTAYKADPNSDEAKLKVRFYVLPFLPIIPVTGDYWVLYIDEDYQYALIGQPSRRYLWILSRRTCLDDEIYNQLVEKAKEEGYDVSKLHKTPQSDSPPESEDSPEDTKGIWWIKSILGK